VIALDAEWERRFPDMVGTLACTRCVVRGNHWSCRAPGGGFVEGHVPVADGSQDVDGWSHASAIGTPVVMAVGHPRSALLQGAEQYVRHAAHQPGVAPEVAQRLRAAIREWDARPGRDADV
jgi:hypothetical protein